MESIAGTNGLTWVVLGVVVFLAGVLRGFSGFGSALLVVPTLSLTAGPAVAVAIATLLEGFATLLLVRAALSHTDTRMLMTMVPAASCAIPLGHMVLTHLDAAVSNLLISFAVTCLAAWTMAGAKLRFPRGLSGQIGAGGLSGFLTGFGGVGGPPLVLYILLGSGSAAVKRANIIVISGAALVAAMVSMALFGLLDRQSLGGGFSAAPIFLAGGIIGARLFKIAPEKVYQRVALGALVALSFLIFAVNLIQTLRHP
jgi:uncharacterized membrane protein YfcA